MSKKIIVISLGGSLIIQEKINIKLIEQFKKILNKHRKKYKFIVVCGGGSVARKYISALRKSGKSQYLQSLVGISITRVNARFISYFFGKDQQRGIPHSINDIKKQLKKTDIVFCGGLKYAPKQTSDSTAAQLAKFFKCEFINLTLVSGLYNKNPLKYKHAKFIPKISWENFNKMIQKIKYKPGQHFVLDQHAAEIIKKNKIKTYILGKNLKNLDNFLSEKKFKGTIISE